MQIQTNWDSCFRKVQLTSPQGSLSQVILEKSTFLQPLKKNSNSLKDRITWTPEPSKLGAGLEAQPPGVGEPLKTTEETVDEATKRSFSESKKSSKSSTGSGVVVVLRVAGVGVVVAKVRTLKES